MRHHPLEDPRDRGFLHEMFFGVLRRRDQLDLAITRLGGRPVQQQPAGLRQVLRLGLYQLFFLDRIPAHAAIHETVGLAINPLRPAANAILREAQRRGAEVMAPDADADPADRAALEAGAPRWMWDYLAGAFGDDAARAILTQAFVVPPLTLRANTLRNTRDELLEHIRPRGFANATATPHSPLGITLGEVEDSRPPEKWPFLAEGLAAMQDESSQLAAMLLSPQPGQRVLDLCAAPGGKATLLAAMMNNTGDLVATDVTDAKRRAIRKLSRRLGASIVRACEAPREGGLWPADGPLAGPPFDAILIDAPCSGFGTLSRHPDIRWSRARGELDDLAVIQAGLLRSAWRRLRPGGRLLYSTCTLGPIENQAIVAAFLADTPDAFVAAPTVEEFPWLPPAMVTVEGFFQTFGEAGVRDGFFAARIEKQATN
jgi:16S rRNA (cytosine967-C5)-methyltransferase